MLSIPVLNHQVMNAWRGVKEAKRHALFTLALDEGEWSGLRPVGSSGSKSSRVHKP
jgi:hypothetical protein